MKNFILAILVFLASISFANVVHAQYYSALSFSQNNVSISVGQTTTITAYSSGGGYYGNLYVSSNSNPNIASVSISGNTISIYGYATGSATIIICQSNYTSSCGTIYVSVSGQYGYSPNYGVAVSSITVPVGGSVTLSSLNSSGITVSSNLYPNIATTSYSTTVAGCTSGSQYSVLTGAPCYLQTSNIGSVTITGVSYGIDTITLCPSNYTYSYPYNSNYMCSTITVNVTSPAIVGTVLGASTYNGACYLSRVLRYGMSGSDVSCLQSYLVALGYLSDLSYIDSYFDMSTHNAVRLFQQANYLFVDGVVGRQTRERLLY